MDGAEAVADFEGDLDILTGIASLVTGSLVRRVGVDAESRFTMLETIQEFARELLIAADEEMAARKAHAAWMRDLVEQAGPALVGRDQAVWLGRLENEVDNLRTALAWAIARNGSETALRLAAAPWLFWFERGRASEGRDWLAKALALAPDDISAARAEALYAAGSLAATQADYPQAETLMETAVAACDALDDAAGLARARQILGTVTLDQDQNQKAVRLFRQSLSGYHVSPDSFDAPWAALARSQLAAALSRLGDREQALALATEAVERQREAGSAIGVALGLCYLGEIAFDWGDRAEAHARFRESMTILRQQGDRWYLLYVLTALVTVLAYEDPPQRAARLFGAETAARLLYRHVAPPRFRKAYDAAVAHVRSVLGEEAFLELQEEGAMLSLHEAAAEALRD
jgi:tetratricopeptide (TPR) repeat protein